MVLSPVAQKASRCSKVDRGEVECHCQKGKNSPESEHLDGFGGAKRKLWPKDVMVQNGCGLDEKSDPMRAKWRFAEELSLGQGDETGLDVMTMPVDCAEPEQ
ncbi:hypothetical protein SRHO_G00254560 [Serrasalmus rhombeus]